MIHSCTIIENLAYDVEKRLFIAQWISRGGRCSNTTMVVYSGDRLVYCVDSYKPVSTHDLVEYLNPKHGMADTALHFALSNSCNT